jgi:hypothetical protein
MVGAALTVGVTPSFARTAGTSAGSNAAVLDGFIVPRQIRHRDRFLPAVGHPEEVRVCHTPRARW